MSPRKIFDGNRFGLNQRESEESNIVRDREQSANLRAQRTNQGTDSDPDPP